MPNARARPFSAWILACGLVATPALAQTLVPVTPLACWEDARLFDSFTSGTVDYCRARLRYVPGALECYRIVDRVCTVFLPLAGEWTEVRRAEERIAVRCPPGRQPPVCRRLDLQ